MWLPQEMQRLLCQPHKDSLSPHAPGRKPSRALWLRAVRFPATLFGTQPGEGGDLAAHSGSHFPLLAAHFGTK